MKKKVIFALIVFTSIISFNYSGGPAAVFNQAYTAAPGESGTVCGNCHSGGVFGTVSGTLSVTDGGGMAVTSYTAGETYQVSLTVNTTSGSPAGYGFQLTVLDGSDNDVASFSNPSGNAQVSTAGSVAGGRTYAEHLGTSGTNTFTVDWVAPAGGTGDLTFYYNVNAVNGANGTAGDVGGFGFSSAFQESNPLVKVVGSLEINNAFTLPNVDGSANQVLTTDGAGTVTWMDAPTSLIGTTTPGQNLRMPNASTNQFTSQKKEIDRLTNEVTYLKSEIEELKRLIQKLTADKSK
ncbi:MAG: hypothetical protein P1U56_08525 [Saprospiraceae bacterium]|nr:hypothetical protein [Saprospiraceae bacterium]